MGNYDITEGRFARDVPVERRQNIREHLEARLRHSKETTERTKRALELLEKNPDIQELIDLLGQI